MDINNLWSEYDLNSKKQNSRCLAVNTILEGKYLVGPVLGQGGFGITYVGYDLNMETKIAIKEYFPVELVSRDITTMHGDRVLSLSGEKSVTYKSGLKKYVAEAQNVSQFSEIPGVVSVKDFFYANETAYIVMEFIDGVSLKDYLKEQGGRLSEEETLKIMKPIFEALVQVHKSGIIHRDISPDNIMLTFLGEDDKNAPIAGTGKRKIKSVKLIDFGAARMTAKNDQKSLTIILKHGYAPEEQYRTHGEQGSWTDVYALCAVLYRMLTGETPVPAMDRMFKDELKILEQYGVKVSANTTAAIMKGLAVKKDDRIQNVQELIDALYKGTKVKPIKTEKASKKTAYMVAGILGAAVLAVGVLVSTVSKVDAPELAQTNVADITVPDISQNTENTGAIKNEQNVEDSDNQGSTGANEISFEEKSDLGETIVFRNPQTCTSGGGLDHILICKPDGTVQAMGSNEYGQCNVEDWTDIVAVSSNSQHSLGLRSDGKVFAAGKNSNGQCEVGSWNEVIQVAAGTSTSFGLTAQGTVLGVGWNGNGVLEQIAEWTEIKSIAVGEDVLIGLDHDGNLHYAGNEREWIAVSDWNDVNYMVYKSGMLLGLKEDGSYEVAKIFEEAGDFLISRAESDSDIQQIYVNSPIVGVRKDGEVFCWTGSSMTGLDIMETALSQWSEMEAVVSAGVSDRIYIVGLKQDGTVIEYKQCYGNSSPEEMENLEWIYPMDGNGHTNLVAKTKEGKLLTYGMEYFRMENYAELNESGVLPVPEIVDVVGMDLMLLANGQLIDCGYEDGFNSVGENVVQALRMGPTLYGIYTALTENGQVQTIVLGDTDMAAEYVDCIQGAEEWDDIVQITGTTYQLYGLHADGTVSEAGDEVRWEEKKGTAGDGYVKIQCSEWDGRELVGLKADGTAEMLVSTELSVSQGRTQITTWDNLEDICLGESHVAGLRKDGTVIAAGSNHAGQCDVEEWTDIVYLRTGKNCTLGITADGELKMAGSLY